MVARCSPVKADEHGLAHLGGCMASRSENGNVNVNFVTNLNQSCFLFRPFTGILIYIYMVLIIMSSVLPGLCVLDDLKCLPDLYYTLTNKICLYFSIFLFEACLILK